MRIAAACAAFAMNVAVTRTLGANEAGLFFLGQTCLIMLAMVSRFGTDNLLVRFVSRFSDQERPEAVNGVLAKASMIALPLSLTTAVVVYCFSESIASRVFSKPEFASVLRFVALCLVPFCGFQLLSFAIQGRKQIATSIAINATVLPVSLLVAAIFARQMGIESAANLMAFAVSVSIANSLVAILIWFRKASFHLDSDSMEWSAVASTTIPLFLVSFFSLATAWAPQLILAMYESAEQIAMLNNSLKTATLVGIVLIAINAVAAPTYASIHQRQQFQTLQDFAARVNGVILLVTTPILLFVFVFAEHILSIFGSSFSSAGWLLRILVIGQFVNAATGSVGYLLTMSGNERHFRNATGLAAVVGIGLSIGLIPSLGAIGAAIATTVAYTISNVYASLMVYQCLGVNVMKPNVDYVFSFLKRAMAERVKS